MQVKNNSSSKIINLSFKQNNYQFSTELLKPLTTFYNEVCSYLQISPNDHDLYYNNKKLTTNYNNSNQTLSDVIQSGTEPFFKITQKKSRTPYKLKLRSDTLDVCKSEKSSFSSRKNLQKNFLTLPKKDNKPRVNNMRYINPVNNNYENL